MTDSDLPPAAFSREPGTIRLASRFDRLSREVDPFPNSEAAYRPRPAHALVIPQKVRLVSCPALASIEGLWCREPGRVPSLKARLNDFFHATRKACLLSGWVSGMLSDWTSGLTAFLNAGQF